MFPLARFRVEDRSMAPALAQGDYVLANRWAYALGKPAKGDVVVLRDPESSGGYLVKRVADVTADGRLFVTGDNVVESRDSRAFGAVSPSLIVGRVWRRVAP
jgi:nickel-type superoxide dismutase maturation protease